MAKETKTIDKLARECKAAFEKLEADVASNEGQDVSDEKARFNVWMDSVMPDTFYGISRLDYQLRDSDSLRSKVRTLLTKLIRILKQAREADAEEVDSVLSDQEVTDDLGFQRLSNQARQIQRARRVVDLLLRLTETVKRPARDDQIRFSASNPAKESNPDLDVEQVQAQFPGIPTYLADRLGLAIWRRRQYFVYKKIMKTRAIDDQEAPEDNAVSNGVAAGDGESRAASCIEFFATAALGAEIELKQWQEPEEGTPFSCPVCHDVFNPSDLDFWLEHIEDDLQAYLCTWEDCGSGSRMYARRKDWQRHEETVHRRIWTCPLECNAIHETATAFSDHLHASHEVDKDPEIIKTLIEASSRPSEPSQVLRCPLCEARITTIDRFYRHVGEHLQYLSYFSLPASLVRERSETDAESAGSDSIRVVEEFSEPSEHSDDTSEEDVAGQARIDVKSRQPIVESDDAEHLSDKAQDPGARVDETGLEVIEIDETPVEEYNDESDQASHKGEIDTDEGRQSTERAEAHIHSRDLALDTEKAVDGPKHQQDVVEVREEFGLDSSGDGPMVEEYGSSRPANESPEEDDDGWGTFGSSQKDKKKKTKKKQTAFDFGLAGESTEPVNEVPAPPPLEQRSIDLTEMIIRDRAPGPLPRERQVFREKPISGQIEEIDDRVRRRTPSPSPPPRFRDAYREMERERGGSVEREESIFERSREPLSVSPPPRTRESRSERDRRDTETATGREVPPRDSDTQYREFVVEYERRRAKEEMERKELLARVGKEFEEKRYKLERERKEMEEKIQMELKKKEEKKQREEHEMAKMVDEKVWSRLSAFGFNDRQIRSIVKGDDKSERTKTGFQAGGRFREEEREYHEPSQLPPKETDYPPYSRDYSYPARDHETWERVAPRPSRRHYFEPEIDLEPIRFEDAEYRRYKLPFKAARTWKGMQKAIREIYQNSDVRDMDEDIVSGRYQMLDADDNGILPSTWEMVVKPGHIYKLAFTRNPNHERSHDRDQPYGAQIRRNDYLDDTLEADEAAQYRRRRRSRSPVIIREPVVVRESAVNPATIPPPPPPPHEDEFNTQADNPFRPVNAASSRPLEQRRQQDTLGGMSYYGDSAEDFDFHRRPRRARSTKAVSFDPYIDDEVGWYPNLESATRGGFRRPGREAEYRPRYQDEPQRAVSYAYPPPRPREHTIQHRKPPWVKARTDHISPETLKYYDLPWEYDMNDNDYIIIRRDLEPHETEILFEHTRTLRDQPAVTAGPSSRREVEVVRA